MKIESNLQNMWKNQHSPLFSWTTLKYSQHFWSRLGFSTTKLHWCMEIKCHKDPLIILCRLHSMQSMNAKHECKARMQSTNAKKHECKSRMQITNARHECKAAINLLYVSSLYLQRLISRGLWINLLKEKYLPCVMSYNVVNSGPKSIFRFEKVNFQVFYFVQKHKKVVRSGKFECSLFPCIIFPYSSKKFLTYYTVEKISSKNVNKNKCMHIKWFL